MMKRLLAILLCGMLMITLCACGSSSDSEEPASAGEEATAAAASEEPAEEERQEVEAAEEEDLPELEEIDAIRLATDFAVQTAIEEQEDGMVFEVEEAEILDENQDAWLVSIPLLEYYNGEPAGGVAYIYRVDKKNGAVKFVTGAQDYWEGMIDITEGVVAEDAAETEYAE